MKTKLLGLVLAATMLFGASMTVFAEEKTSDVTGQKIDVTSTVNTYTLKVEVTANTEVLANPYGLIDADKAPSGQTFVSDKISFENKGNVAVGVTLKGMVSANSTLKASTSKTKPTTSTDKQYYVAAKIMEKDTTGNNMVTSETATTGETLLVYGGNKEGTAVTVNLERASSKADNSDTVTPKTYGAGKTKNAQAIDLIFDGWTCAAPGKAWGTDDTLKISTIYDIKGLDADAKLSLFLNK